VRALDTCDNGLGVGGGGGVSHEGSRGLVIRACCSVKERWWASLCLARGLQVFDVFFLSEKKLYKSRGNPAFRGSFSVVTWCYFKSWWVILHVTAPLCPECHRVLQRMPSCRVWVFASKNFISSEKHETLKWCIHKVFKFQSWKQSDIKFVSEIEQDHLFCLKLPSEETNRFYCFFCCKNSDLKTARNLPVVLYGCESYCFVLGGDHTSRLKVFLNGALRGILGLKTEEATRGWRKSHNEERHN
jgi:hypothetical protein